MTTKPTELAAAITRELPESEPYTSLDEWRKVCKAFIQPFLDTLTQQHKSEVAELRRIITDYIAVVGEWRQASGLIVEGGDPSAIWPEQLAKRIAEWKAELAKAEAVIRECKAYRVMPPDVERAIAEYEATK